MKKLIIALALLTAACHHKEEPKKEFTNIEIKNSSSEDSVLVYVTLQAPNSVVGLFGISDTLGSCSKGYFYAYKDSSYFSDCDKELLGVVISFGGDNLPCQTAIPLGYRWGINIFECSINTKFESFDISVEDGVNCIVKASVNDSTWTTGYGVNIAPFYSAQNKFPIDSNLNIRGVFPYTCSDCIDKGQHPADNCLGLKDTCNTIRACQTSRTGEQGGKIKVEYLGAIQILK